jgi:cyclopropane-fatty-acyl-phospholipid synthase
VGTIEVRDAAAFLRICADPEVQLGDLYAEGRVAFHGPLHQILTALFEATPQVDVRRWVPDALRRRLLDTSLVRARDNAQHHYDAGNDFYQLWLDERMLYTCAYFCEAGMSLEDAQLAKMDHVCRKLSLRPGEEVVEAGCGWGSLALHMARHYGVTVTACNVAHEQVAYAREQAEKQGLADRVEFIEDDYRNLERPCDAFVSVGMLEHVGPAHYADLGRVAQRLLRAPGRGLIHTIGRSQTQSLSRWIRKRVFPNAHPPTLREMMEIFEPQDFAVLDVENLRLHYRDTAREWLRRYEAALPTLEGLVGPERTRTWHLYLAGAWSAFARSALQLYQVVFTRARNDHIPRTRAHLYTGEATDFFDEVPHPERSGGA